MSNILQNCSRGFPSQFRRTSDLTTCHSYILFSRGRLIEVIFKSIRQNDLWDILIINTFTVLLLDAYEFPTRSMKFYTFEIYYLPINFMILLLKLLSQLHLKNLLEILQNISFYLKKQFLVKNTDISHKRNVR